MNKLILSFVGIFCLISCNMQNSTTTEKTNVIIDMDSVYNRNMKDSTLVTGWYYIKYDGNGFKRKLEKTDEIYFIDPRPIVVAANLTITMEKNAWDKYFLSMSMDKQGTKAWSDATDKTVAKKLAFVLEDRLLYTPTVYSQITGGVAALNSSDYTKEEYEAFLKLLWK